MATTFKWLHDSRWRMLVCDVTLVAIDELSNLWTVLKPLRGVYSSISCAQLKALTFRVFKFRWKQFSCDRNSELVPPNAVALVEVSKEPLSVDYSINAELIIVRLSTHFFRNQQKYIERKDDSKNHAHSPISRSENSSLLFLISVEQMLWTNSVTTMEHLIMMHIIWTRPSLLNSFSFTSL